jgi:hypothetical protein
MELNNAEIKGLVVDKAVEKLENESVEILNNIEARLQVKAEALVMNHFEHNVKGILDNIINDLIKDGLDKEYTKRDFWGESKGEATTIKKELEGIISNFWETKVTNSGAATTNRHNAVTRAEYIMMKVCADDFVKNMEQTTADVVGNLKDGLRDQLYKHMDQSLDGLFRIKSLQDQGKVEKRGY